MVSEEKLLRKIRKYNRKLERRRRSRRRSHDSDERRSGSSNRRRSGTRERSPLRTDTPDDEDDVICQGEIPPKNLVPEDYSAILNVQIPEVDHQDSLDNELLQALGQEYEDNKKFEGTINNNICKRWNYILTHGLSKTEKEEIYKLHSLPENCQLLEAPILNEEVAAVTSESGKARDKCIAYQQKQMGTALTIIGKVMSNLILDSMDKIDMLKSLSQAAKLIGDLHHQQTKTRRSLVAPQLDKQFLEMTQNTIRNEYLYGENLSERIKVNKIIQQSSNSIKKPPVKPAIPAKNPNKYNMGNRSGPPRQMIQRQATKAMAQGGPRYRQQPLHNKTTSNPQRSERTRSAHYKKNRR